jgi:hypothetical protein
MVGSYTQPAFLTQDSSQAREVGGSADYWSFIGTFLQASGSFNIGAYVQNQQFSIVDMSASLLSGSFLGSRLNAYAKFMGNDIVPPVSAQGSGSLDQNLADANFPPYDKVLASPHFDFGYGFGGDIELHLKGNVHFTMNAHLDSMSVYMDPRLVINSSLYGGFFVDFESIIRGGLEGNATLINDTLTFHSEIDLTYSGNSPSLTGLFWIWDDLQMLGGELDWVLQVDTFVNGWQDIASTPFMSWPQFEPVNGYLFNSPWIFTVPLPPM